MSLTSYRAAPPRVTVGHYRWTASHRVQYINAGERADEESRPVRRAAVDRWAYNTIHQAVNPDRSVIPNGRGRIEKCAHSSRAREHCSALIRSFRHLLPVQAKLRRRGEKDKNSLYPWGEGQGEGVVR